MINSFHYRPLRLSCKQQQCNLASVMSTTSPAKKGTIDLQNIKLLTESVTKGSSGGVQHAPEISLTYFQKSKLKSYYCCTATKKAIRMGLIPHTPIHGGPPHNLQVFKDLSLTSWSQKPQYNFSILMDTMHLWVRAVLAVLALFKQCLNSSLLIELRFLHLCRTPRFSAF